MITKPFRRISSMHAPRQPLAASRLQCVRDKFRYLFGSPTPGSISTTQPLHTFDLPLSGRTPINGIHKGVC
jgi:hypothetical protein